MGGDIFYDGFQLGFDYRTEILDFILTKPNNSLNYKGHLLKVGMSVADVRNLFGDSYDSRYTIKLGGGSTVEHVIRVQTDPYNNGPTILFTFNPTSQIITEVLVYFPFEWE